MGGREVEESSRSRKVVNLSVRRKWLKTKEKWLAVVGVVLHAVYMLSIFDIYFKSPIVHGMDLVSPRFPAPAKRLVLLVDSLGRDEDVVNVVGKESMKQIRGYSKLELGSVGPDGSWRVGAEIGTRESDKESLKELVKAGIDVVVLDISQIQLMAMVV